MTPLTMSDDSDYDESDVELQEAFAKGLLKPGLNEVLENQKRNYANNESGLKSKLNSIKLKLPWIERLDLVNEPAPMAPELALQLQDQEDKRTNQMKNNKKLPQLALSDDPILNDFKREMLFHRQAQAAVLEGIPKLKKMGIPTKRPDDYFAEMAKSDEQMQRIRQGIMKKQQAAEKSERVKQIRAQRKMGKEIQIQAKLKRQSDKTEMLNQVKKFRKGQDKNLSFLNDSGGKGNPKMNKKSMNRKKRDSKFGFGGRKKGSKKNTSQSTLDFENKRSSGGRKPMFGKNKQQRPGKNRRLKQKSMSKRK